VPSSTNVIAVGIDPAPLIGHARDPLALPIDAPRDAFHELAAELHADAVAILPTARVEPALRRLEVLQSSLDGRARIACCRTSLSPLAASALVRLAASVAPAVPAALLADALPALEQELLVAALVPSVLRLRDPAPPLRARLRSLLPGARYLLSPDPEPMVAALHGGRSAPVLLDDAADEVAVVAAGRLRGTESPAQLLSGVFGGAEVDEVQAPRGLAARWRSSQVVEAVAYPTDADAMARRLMAVPSTSCPWCGARHAALPCVLCGHDRDRAIARQEVPA
jgi:hypothetical protein